MNVEQTNDSEELDNIGVMEPEIVEGETQGPQALVSQEIGAEPELVSIEVPREQPQDYEIDLETVTDEYEDLKIVDYPTSYNKINGNKIDLVNLKYKSNIDHLSCPICQQPFIEPMTTTCGHTFCKSCIQECFKINNHTCPLDRTSLDENNINDLFPTPLIITNLIDELEVYCLNYKRGCNWVGCRWEINHHVVQKCGFTGIPCNGDRNGEKCKLLVERRFKKKRSENEDDDEIDDDLKDNDDNDKHGNDEFNNDDVDVIKKDDDENVVNDDNNNDDNDFNDDEEDDYDEINETENCVHRLYNCKHCQEKICKITEEVHLQTQCEFNYKTCKLCLNDYIAQKNLTNHTKNCQKIGKLQCPANVIGCKWVGQNQTNLEIHLENNCQLNSFLPYYNKMNSRIDELSQENQQLQRKINKILNLIIQGKILNLGYNDNLQNIDKQQDVDYDNKLIYLNFEFDRLKFEINQKILPFLSNFNNFENLINNLINDNHILKEDLNLQRMIVQSLRKQLQFLLFKKSDDYDLPRTTSDERLNLKL